MKKLLPLLFTLLTTSCAWTQSVYVPPISKGHTIAPHLIFFNKDCSKALTVSKAELITWDVASGKTIDRAVLAYAMKGYNPYEKDLRIKATPSPDLSEVIVELVGDKKEGFIFNMKIGKLSIGDAAFNPWITSFTPNGDYVVMRDFRAAGKTPSGILQTFLKPDGGTNIVVQHKKQFYFTGFSMDGSLYWGKNDDNDRFILYDPSTGKVTETKLKYAKKIQHYFYYTDGFYSPKWISRVPDGEDWRLSRYEVATGRIVRFEEKGGVKGPFVFSDNGKLGVYFQADPGVYLVKNMSDMKTVYTLNAPDGSSESGHIRLPENSNKLFVMGNNNVSLFTYELEKKDPITTFNLMADEQTIAMAKAMQEGDQNIKNIEKEAISDFNLKNFLVNFPEITHFSFNLSTAHTLKGTDITSLPYTSSHYTNGLGSDMKVLSVLGLGKLSSCDGGAIVFGVVRAVLKGKEDRTLFFIDKIDSKGKSTQFETVGLMSKVTGGGNFLATLDLGVYAANNKVAVVTDQRYTGAPKSNYIKTLMIDQSTCVITFKK